MMITKMKMDKIVKTLAVRMKIMIIQSRNKFLNIK